MQKIKKLYLKVSENYFRRRHCCDLLGMSTEKNVNLPVTNEDLRKIPLGHVAIWRVCGCMNCMWMNVYLNCTEKVRHHILSTLAVLLSIGMRDLVYCYDLMYYIPVYCFWGSFYIISLLVQLVISYYTTWYHVLQTDQISKQRPFRKKSRVY